MANEENKIRVKILTNVGIHVKGQEVDVTESEANAMCTVRERHDGQKLIPYQTAMLMTDFEKMKSAPIDKGGLTQCELSDLGEKNVVPTPSDPSFEARLAAAKKAADEQHEEAEEKDKKKSKKSSKFSPSFEEKREESA